MITRVGLCEICYELGEPKPKAMYLVFGASKKSYVFYKARNRTTPGLTPHLYSYLGVIDENTVRIKSVCCMCGCGIEVGKEKKGLIGFEVARQKIHKMPLKQWNALINFTDTGLEI